MRARIVLLLSLLLNLASLLYIFAWQRRSHSELPDSSPVRTRTVLVPTGIKTNVVVRRRSFEWNDIESDNYPLFIKNLRDIGCPERTIRDIIVADVNELYERKKITDVVTPDQQWWKSEPDLNTLEAAGERQQELEKERRVLLTELLGPNWDADTLVPPLPIAGRSLDGPILGTLESGVKAELRQMETKHDQQLHDYLESRQKAKTEPDPAELARLRQALRDDLAKILTPPQLEEYQLRYSNTADTLRKDLRGFGATPDEFRAIFRARDQIDQEIALHLTGDDPAVARRRKELEDIREATLKQTLGPERYPLYQFTQNPLFRQAQLSAEKAGAPPEMVLPLFEVNQAIAREQERIRNAPNLSPAEQAAALFEVTASQEDSLRKLLGEEGYASYLRAQRANQ